MRVRTNLVLIGLALSLQSCSYYSFTGVSIPPHLRTIAIPLAEDESIGPLTLLDESLTELMIDRFVRQTRLSLIEDEAEADLLLTAQIIRYGNAPTSVTGQERAQLNRVSISITAQYINQVDDDTMERTFSGFDDYDALEGGLEAEELAALAALENIADDLFTAATSNW
ncbi:MAG: LPS assembly lipoprotein LptE [Bacteroidetes bacterium]|nr:LPS assembly lipoprotein LptE [Bacteroidota bacterium]MCY4205183.1 LPS assembly lipoprotein LptE [Bacteroidota bacterium]